MEKRERPSWDEYFMFAALSAATRSSCLYLHTGAVIVKDKRIVSSGYNGAPQGIENCLVRGCRKRQHGIDFGDKGKGQCRGCHGEKNGMDQIARESLKGALLYTVYFPCSGCAKDIVGKGLSEVIYIKEYHEGDTLTRELFTEAGVSIRKLELDLEKYFEMMRSIKTQVV